MKKWIIFITIVILILGCNSLEKRKEVNSKIILSEVHNLSALSNKVGKVSLSWSPITDKNISKLELYKRYLKTNGDFRKIKDLEKITNSIELEEDALERMEYKLVTVSKDGQKSKGVVVKVDIKHKNVIYDNFNDRTLAIYLPDSYFTSDKRYPVAYMFDGDGQFIGSGGMQVDEEIDRLVKEGKIEEMIVVGIYHKERDYELQFYGGTDFPNLLAEKIIPYIDNKYRTKTNRENRAVIGSSYGGQSALAIFANYNDLFQTAGGLSPSLWGVYNQVDSDLKKINPDSKIWICRGTKEWWDFTERRLTKSLTANNMKYGENLIYYEAKNGTHTYQSWGERVANIFILFKGKKADKPINIEFYDQLYYDYNSLDLYFILNPIVEMDNGMKYSLLDYANYKIINEEDGTINKDGVFTFINPKDLIIEVEYKGFKKTVTINYEKSEKKINSKKRALKKEFKKEISHEGFIEKLDRNRYLIPLNTASKQYKISKENLKKNFKKMEKNSFFKIIEENEDSITIDFNI